VRAVDTSFSAALHDMGDPVGALRTARAVLADGGSALVADERVADAFATLCAPTLARPQMADRIDAWACALPTPDRPG
jgi:hypothetical protein